VISERRVKLFKSGRNQAVRIPREFELYGEDAIMRKEGDRLIIEPAPPKSLLALLATLAPLDEEFPPIPDAVPDPVKRCNRFYIPSRGLDPRAMDGRVEPGQGVG
jgi:antitoxin VapB